MVTTERTYDEAENLLRNEGLMPEEVAQLTVDLRQKYPFLTTLPITSEAVRQSTLPTELSELLN